MKKKSTGPPRGVFRPLRTARVVDRVAEQLKKVVRGGVFRVGDRLPSERELAEQMGVSRPSVREAIQQLEMLGMVESVHGEGTVIRNLAEQELSKPLESLLEDDKHRVLELTEVRACLEPWAARHAAENRTAAELDHIGRCLGEMQSDLEKGQIRAELDFQFHVEIAAATHNMIFLHLIQSIHELISYSLKVHREKVFVEREDQERLLSHHRRVFKAIENQDPQAAEAAMSDHLLFVVREFEKRLLSQ